jgi:hypothetical protein
LVVWNMNFIFPYIGNNNTNWLYFHIFQRGCFTTNQIFSSIFRNPYCNHWKWWFLHSFQVAAWPRVTLLETV